MEQEEYRGSIIHYEIHKRSEFWNAPGHGELKLNNMFRRFSITGPTDMFTSREDAKRDFINKAKEWIDRQNGMYRHGPFTKDGIAERQMIRDALRDCSSSAINCAFAKHVFLLRVGDLNAS